MPEVRDAPRILVVTAHPDDVDFGAAGTVATWTEQGIDVTYCIVTDGAAGSADPTIDLAALAEIRQAEQRKAAAEVGVTDLHFLAYPDGALELSMALRRDLSRVIRIVRPERVVAQSPERNWDRIRASHPDHLVAGEATLQAVYPDARNPYAHRGAARRRARAARRRGGLAHGLTADGSRPSTSPRPSSARSRRCSATEARSPIQRSSRTSSAPGRLRTRRASTCRRVTSPRASRSSTRGSSCVPGPDAGAGFNLRKSGNRFSTRERANASAPDFDLVRRPSWQRYAACRGQDIEEFFPAEGSGATRTAAICARCPVAEECLAYALDNPGLKGVWAGTSERRRRRMRMATG